jgi:hypothetical protein
VDLFSGGRPNFGVRKNLANQEIKATCKLKVRGTQPSRLIFQEIVDIESVKAAPLA